MLIRNQAIYKDWIMTKNLSRNEELSFDDSVKQNKKGEAILGRLTGPCADFISPTRNGRMYDEELWEKVFNSEIVNEYFENGGILGELDHPADRSETCMEKVAICMPEKPKRNNDGQLIATFDILDTPNGRIAHTLAKYGYKLGISSRGTGDVYEDYSGTDHVDSDTYDFQGFDLVLLPAVKAARLKMVESVQGQASFKKALLEQLNHADADSKRIMTETLHNLNIDYVNENVEVVTGSEAAIDDGAGVIKELQESIKRNKALEEQLQTLQEKLSVCYAKEVKYQEDLQKYKSSVISLSESAKSAKALRSRVDSLNEQLNQKDILVREQEQKLIKLSERQKVALSSRQALKESVSTKDAMIRKLEENIKAIKRNSDKELESLRENLEEVKANSTIKSKEYNEKLSKSNNLVEHYKKIATIAVDRYIDSKAKMLGISSNEIKGKLGENYSFKDIDNLCESLQSYQLNLSNLPFNIPAGRKVKAKVTESKEPIKLQSRFDDEVDDQLLRLADD